MPRSGNTTADPSSTQHGGPAVDDAPKVVPAFALLWCTGAPLRVGEVALLSEGRQYFGREDEELDAITFVRMRPGRNERTGRIENEILSRRQMQIDVDDGVVVIRNVGRRKITVNGKEVTEAARLAPNDVVAIEGVCGMMLTTRPTTISKAADIGIGAFGEPDRHGIVGESAAIWELRERIAFVAAFDEPTLVLGESGTGKELVVQAIHRMSRRAHGPFVDRSAPSIAQGLVAVDLFGNAKNWPNPGMPESDGLIGAARGGALFLDEIAEIPPEMQAPLLRVLDEAGSYQRLGDPKPRKADVRIYSATNRQPYELKFDFAARFELRLEAPSFEQRREDIPLLARAIVLKLAQKSRQAVEKFIDASGPRPEVRLDPALVAHLVQREYTTNMRELGRLLKESMAASRDGVLRVTPAMLAPRPAAATPAGAAPTEADVRAALTRSGGNQTHAATALGIRRDTLIRLMKKYGLRRGT